MGLTPDEQALLDQLTAKASADDADDFEVEIFQGDRGARIPMSKAAAWLYKEFGIGDPPAAPAGGGKDDGKGGDGGDGKDGDKGPVSLFRSGRRSAGGGK